MKNGDGVLTDRAEHDAPAWLPSEIADVAQATVKGDNHAVLVGRRADDHPVLPAAKVFVEHRVNVVAASGELVGHIVRQVLVELETHAGNGKISSRARAAP